MGLDRSADTFRILTGDQAVDTRCPRGLQKEIRSPHAVLQTQIENLDKLVGNWRTPKDAQIKEAF